MKKMCSRRGELGLSLVLLVLITFFASCEGGNDDDTTESDASVNTDAGGPDGGGSIDWTGRDNPFGGVVTVGKDGGIVVNEDGKASSYHHLRASGVTEMTSRSYKLFIGSLDTVQPVGQKSNSYLMQPSW